jgi:putative nucleotidyltransferase with HDIG domain
MTERIALSEESPARSRHSALSALAVLVLAAAIYKGTPVQISAVLVAAVITAILDRFPIYLNPIGEIPITGVITVPTLVLFGWPTAVIGSALAIVPSFFSRPLGHALIRGSERLIGLATAAWVVQLVRFQGPYKDVDAVVMAALAVGVTHTMIATIRLHFEEGIAWLRGLSYLVEATSFHHIVVMTVAAVAVWTLTSSTSTIDRLLVPVIAAAVTLQLYLPRILRGQQQRRVLAAVSVLAAAVDAKDSYTADHSQSVAQLCQRVARAQGMNEQQVHRVYLAALLHDVGKTVVPIGILRKPGALTLEERDVIRSHVDAGVRIIKTIRGLADVAPIVEASHERMDGAGYPKGLKGDDIPLAARIILAVDAYNAMTTNRT